MLVKCVCTRTVHALDDDRLQETNEERVQLVQGIVDALDLRTNLIFAAHSRGSENAVRMGALNRVSCVCQKTAEKAVVQFVRTGGQRIFRRVLKQSSL